MLQKLKSFVDLLTLRDFPESLAYFNVTDNGSAGCNFLIVRVRDVTSTCDSATGSFQNQTSVASDQTTATVPFYREVFANGARHDRKIGI